MYVAIEAVNKWFGENHVLRDCDLNVDRGELITLLGPSGCGKTTLLRCLAGFELPNSGELSVDGKNLTYVAPNRRNVGFVFQNYALFPHLTVAQNIGYGLSIRRTSKAEIAKRVEVTLGLVSLEEFADRYPAQLSGGQQQRVALARALILEPSVLLLDEAFNALDAKLRVSMQVELRKLVKKVGITTICVTHDQIEALTISDRIAVMFGGKIDQIATPREVYEKPRTPFVAGFLGTTNLLERVAKNGGIPVGPGITLPTDLAGPVSLVARPEDLTIGTISPDGWTGTVSFVRLLGPSMEYEIQMPNDECVKVLAPRRGDANFNVGDQVGISLEDFDSCVVIPGGGGQ